MNSNVKCTMVMHIIHTQVYGNDDQNGFRIKTVAFEKEDCGIQ